LNITEWLLEEQIPTSNISKTTWCS
jgi:hypothetical protein